MILLMMFFLAFPDTTNFENLKVNSDEDPVLPFHNEEQVVVNQTDSLNLVACWRDFRLGYRQVGIGVSFDGGKTWEDRLLVGSGYIRDSDPGLTTDALGNIYLVTLSYSGSTSGPNALAVFKSDDGGLNFTLQGYASESQGSYFEDKELMGCDRTNSQYRGNLYVVWARFAGSSRIYGVTSSDQGETWSNPVAISDDNGVQWPVPCVGKDGTVYTAWMSYGSPNPIMLDRSYDGGTTWGADITLVPSSMGIIRLDGWIGTFSFPAMDADITDGPYGGNLYVAYANYGTNGSADIFFIRSSDGGDTWSQPLLLSGNEEPDNDQFHPWIAVDNLGIIHVVFYDQRNGIADDLLDFYYVKSEDGGENWTEPERITTVASKPGTTEPPLQAPSPMPGEIYGEYIGLAAWDGIPFPVWTDSREDGVENVYFGWQKRSTGVNESKPAMKCTISALFTSHRLEVDFGQLARGNYDFYLFDASGRCLASTGYNCSSASSTNFRWSIPDLSSGIYFLEVQGRDVDTSVKVVKLH